MGQKIVFMAQQNSSFHPGQDRRRDIQASKDVNMGNFESDIGFHRQKKKGETFLKLLLNVRAFQSRSHGTSSHRRRFLDVAEKRRGKMILSPPEYKSR